MTLLRRAALSFIVALAVADTVAAGCLWLLWHDRHGVAQAARPAVPARG